jgi:hypothetical protein
MTVPFKNSINQRDFLDFRSHDAAERRDCGSLSRRNAAFFSVPRRFSHRRYIGKAAYGWMIDDYDPSKRCIR